MKQVNTKFDRIREIKVHFERSTSSYSFLVAVSTDSRFAIYEVDKIISFSEDLGEIKPTKIVKTKGRITCISINDLS